jgi:hypothetical protein
LFDCYLTVNKHVTDAWIKLSWFKPTSIIFLFFKINEAPKDDFHSICLKKTRGRIWFKGRLVVNDLHLNPLTCLPNILIWYFIITYQNQTTVINRSSFFRATITSLFKDTFSMLDRKGWNETGRHRTSKSFVYFLVYKGLNYTTVRVALYLISLLSHIITYLISLLMIFVFDLCYSHCMPLLPLYQIIS